ncbi:MAG: serine/threonine-protein phosphatase [Saprospiraceae bacterium]|nr:serine/threonine-protein phosphatase [Saprospiraceae bacterium]
MTNLQSIKNNMNQIEKLQRELHLKQLQVNRLLSITQAINNNLSAKDLFEMYKNFLNYEMGIKKMALHIQEPDETWCVATSIGIPKKLLSIDITLLLKEYTSLNSLSMQDHPLLSKFDVVIPVSHKEQPIAYVFLGGFEAQDDMYDKVQFITALTNIIAVAIENKRLFKRQLYEERYRREMEVASAMQRDLVPKTLPNKGSYQLDSIYKPHLSVGGDYFDFMEFGEGKILFCVGDISGKGLAAALLMANFQAIFHTLADKRSEMGEFVRNLNQALFRITRGDRFITFFVAEYNILSGKLSYVNAGHNPPILVQNGLPYLLKKGTTLLGCFEELPFLEIGEMYIQEEALVFVYTDGLTDIQDATGNYLDIEHLEQFSIENAKLAAVDFNKNLVVLTEQFMGDNQDYPDDFTVLTCKLFTSSN